MNPHESQPRPIGLWPFVTAAALMVGLIWFLTPRLHHHDLPPRGICASNLRGIGQAEAIYADDNPNWFPIHYFQGADDPNADGTNPVKLNASPD